MRGRKPTPTALFLLRGKPNHGRRVNELEPKPAAVRGALPPSWLGAKGAKLWTGLIDVLTGMRVLTSADLDGVALLCSCYEEFLESKRKRRGSKGREASMDRWQRQLRAWLTEFGLTPAARSRLQVVPTKEHDPLDDYFRKGKPP